MQHRAGPPRQTPPHPVRSQRNQLFAVSGKAPRLSGAGLHHAHPSDFDACCRQVRAASHGRDDTEPCVFFYCSSVGQHRESVGAKQIPLRSVRLASLRVLLALGPIWLRSCSVPALFH